MGECDYCGEPNEPLICNSLIDGRGVLVCLDCDVIINEMKEPPSTWLPPNAPDTSAPAPVLVVGPSAAAEVLDTLLGDEAAAFCDDLCTFEGDGVDHETGCLEQAVRVVGGAFLCQRHSDAFYDDMAAAALDVLVGERDRRDGEP